MYTLFAYTRDPSQRLVRFAVDQTVQRELTTYLDAQVSFFEQEREDIIFDGKYKPDDDEMLVIEGFDDIDNLAAAIVAPLNFPIADPNNFSFDQIRALFFGKTENGTTSVYLQNFDKRKLISETGFSIFHAQNVYKRIEGTGLTLNTKITAKLQGNVLKFFSFFLISQMFDMSSYYQVATDADIAEFANLPQVSVQDQDALISVSDNWVRNKFWLIKQSGILEKVAPADLKVIAAEFGIPVVYEAVDGTERLQLPIDKKQLKTLLRFLDEDYYKSPLSKTNFVTNSKRAV
ncbi:MAG: hypothetical protein ACEQSE_12210 [Candidatus Aquirickettsiella gammari]|uniref:hypothetical protein n=1 Tax=Undibacterium sp. Ji22W TaxID=3413038 RepID=UPI0028EED6B1|nr:hypothetical protein [uncultured Undibacterium sp.]